MQGKSYTGKHADKSQLLIKLFESAHLLDSNGKPDAEKVITMESLKGFTAYCGKVKLKIQRLLVMEVRSDLKEKPTTQLNVFLSLCGLKLLKSNTISKGDKKIYEYQLDRRSYDKSMDLIHRREASRAMPEPETKSTATYQSIDPLDT